MPAKALNVRRSEKCRSGLQPIQAVLYVRVSSKDQEKEGFSIPSQIRLLREYAANRGLIVVREFEDIETAKASGRRQFNEMLAYLKRHHASCRTILTEKTDRLYRNPKDWVTLDELDVEIHFVKENEIASRNSRSSEKFMHGMKVLMAKNFVDNLSEETKKGMLEKARAGIYPSYAPVGYQNTDGPNGKRVIIPDPATAPAITELFERFATGKHSLMSLVVELRAEGIALRGHKLYKSVAHQILRKRLYMGEFDWDGTTYQGVHDPLVSRECWQRVQELLDGRAENRTRKVKHAFVFGGLIHCGHCGCRLVAELKKHRYVYYHCTGNRGKCPEPYTRQEVLTDKFKCVLQEFVIPQPILDWLTNAVLQSDRTEQATRERIVKRLWGDHERLNARIETMYLDKVDGRITGAFFDQRAAAVWRQEQSTILGKIHDLQHSAPAPVDEAIDMLRLTSHTCSLFEQQSSSEQRRLLQLLIKNAAWQEGELRTTLFEPFELLRHSNRESHRKEREVTGSGRDLGIWLPKSDSK